MGLLAQETAFWTFYLLFNNVIFAFVTDEKSKLAGSESETGHWPDSMHLQIAAKRLVGSSLQ